MTCLRNIPRSPKSDAWRNARRYFKEAMPTAAVVCAQALAIIGQLYGIERAASDKHLDAPARQRLRQEQASALPKSPLLSTAVGYALRNWIALTRYTEDGRLKIDNNGAEQALRPIVLGRKNWLFAGSGRPSPGAEASCHDELPAQTHNVLRSLDQP